MAEAETSKPGKRRAEKKSTTPALFGSVGRVRSLAATAVWLAAVVCALVLAVGALLASVLAPARRLVLWTAVGSAAVGVAGLASGQPATWSLLALGLGVLAGLGSLLRGRLGRNR